jgi:hypothetical protein
MAVWNNKLLIWCNKLYDILWREVFKMKNWFVLVLIVITIGMYTDGVVPGFRVFSSSDILGLNLSFFHDVEGSNNFYQEFIATKYINSNTSIYGMIKRGGDDWSNNYVGVNIDL